MFIDTPYTKTRNCKMHIMPIDIIDSGDHYSVHCVWIDYFKGKLLNDPDNQTDKDIFVYKVKKPDFKEFIKRIKLFNIGN